MSKELDIWGQHILSELRRFNREHSAFNKKIDRLDGRFDHYNETLVRNTVSLEEHIKRTNLLEKQVAHVSQEVEGLREHVSFVRHAFSLFSFLSGSKFKVFLKAALILGTGAASYVLVAKDWIAKLFH